jgi:hypothetical protein
MRGGQEFWDEGEDAVYFLFIFLCGSVNPRWTFLIARIVRLATRGIGDLIPRGTLSAVLLKTSVKMLLLRRDNGWTNLELDL